MKAKKLIPILSIALSFGCFTGCMNNDQKMTFGNYWNTASLTHESVDETLVYDVRQEEVKTGLFNYSIEYTNGKYLTRLVSATENGQNIYVYTTQLTIDVTFDYIGAKNETPFEDSVITETRFYTADNALRPISSKKTVYSHSPMNGSPSSVEQCYQLYHYEVVTNYESTNGKGSSTITYLNTDKENSSSTNDFEIEQKKFSYLDNEQLPFALRGISSTDTSATVLVYNPFLNTAQQVSLKFSSEESAEFSFYRGGSTEKSKELITYRPATMVLNEKNPGATQKIWVAKTTNPQNNAYRNVILKMETPLSYGLGTLVYELNSTSW